MIYWLKYIALLPLFILMRLSTYPLAPIAVAFFREGYQLKSPFLWLQTDDNDLRGDEAWLRHKVNVTAYWAMVQWLWRNGGHHAAYNFFGCHRPSDYPTHRSFTPLWGKTLELYLGWSGNEPRGKFVLTARWRDRNY